MSFQYTKSVYAYEQFHSVHIFITRFVVVLYEKLDQLINVRDWKCLVKWKSTFLSFIMKLSLYILRFWKRRFIKNMFFHWTLKIIVMSWLKVYMMSSFIIVKSFNDIPFKLNHIL